MNIFNSQYIHSLPVGTIAGKVNSLLTEHSRIVVTAPPGAGKSTLLPLTILDSITDGKVIVLEPRRIAACGIAERMASMIGERVGETVGYRVRFDTKVSRNTRIEVVTEGILTRMIAPRSMASVPSSSTSFMSVALPPTSHSPLCVKCNSSCAPT